MPMPDRSMPLLSGSVSGFSTCGIYFRRRWIPATQLLSSPLFACSPFPVNMAAQNWDDHDRDGRYATIAHAKNYLSTCAPNAILFTYGDNDTFPLWYAQEVEGFRPGCTYREPKFACRRLVH